MHTDTDGIKAQNQQLEMTKYVIYILVAFAIVLVIISLIWVSLDRQYFISEESRHSVLQTLFGILQLPAILVIVYEIRGQLDQRRKPIINIGVKATDVNFHQVSVTEELQASDELKGASGKFRVILRNDGDANLNGMSIRVFSKSDRNIKPPDRVHMYDRENGRVWYSTPLLNRLVRKEPLSIAFEVDRSTSRQVGEVNLSVTVYGDNLPEPIEKTLTLTHSTW